MKIIEKIKTAVEHTSDSWQQKLLDDYNRVDNPGARARKIISELVAPLQKPNQVIINDIVSLIYALASNPDPSIDIDQVVSTAELLINDLVESIPNPDKRLMDELLHIIVSSAQHSPSANAARAASVAAQNMPAKPVPVSAPAAPQSTQPPTPAPVAASQPAPISAPKPSQSASSQVDTPMIKLIMDEMKDVIKKGQATEQRIAELENKLTARITAMSEDVQLVKDKVKKQEADLDVITKNMDKFISLYEIVINQYNPFIEHIDEPQKAVKATPNVTAPSQAPQSTPSAATKSIPLPQSPNDISILIDEVKGMSDADFAADKEKVAQWIETVFKDKELSTSFRATTAAADAVKILLKKSLQSHRQS